MQAESYFPSDYFRSDPQLSPEEAARLGRLNANRQEIHRIANQLQPGNYWLGQIPGSDLFYDELQALTLEITARGRFVATVAGCGHCEAHRENPLPHIIAMANGEGLEVNAVRRALEAMIGIPDSKIMYGVQVIVNGQN